MFILAQHYLRHERATSHAIVLNFAVRTAGFEYAAELIKRLRVPCLLDAQEHVTVTVVVHEWHPIPLFLIEAAWHHDHIRANIAAESAAIACCIQ